jgi:hypothetical protein
MATTQKTFIACEFCGAPVEQLPMAYRLKYHPACKRAMDRARAKAATNTSSIHHDCGHCGRQFVSRRRDAKFCSTRCRTAAHRAG